MRTRKTLLSMPIALALLASCSIKEDRSPCPCWLQVDLSEINCAVHLTGWAADRMVFAESPIGFGSMTVEPFVNVEQDIVLNSTRAITVPPNPSETLREFKVPRGMVTISAICATSSPINSGRIEIPLGRQADELYGHSAGVNTNAEFAYDKVTLQKQFATVHLTMELPEGCTTFPYDVLVSGNTCGWDIKTLRGIEGRFEYKPSRRGFNEYEFRVPRQADNSLRVDLLDWGELVDSVKIGELIALSGYDWSKPSLDDINLDVNFTDSFVKISITGWDQIVILEITI